MRGHWLSTTRKLNNHYQSGTSVSRFGVEGFSLPLVLRTPFSRSIMFKWVKGEPYPYISFYFVKDNDAYFSNEKPIAIIPDFVFTAGTSKLDFSKLIDYGVSVKFSTSTLHGNFTVRRENITYKIYRGDYDGNMDITGYTLVSTYSEMMNVVYYNDTEEDRSGVIHLNIKTPFNPRFDGKLVTPDIVDFEDNKIIENGNMRFQWSGIASCGGRVSKYTTTYEKRINGAFELMGVIPYVNDDIITTDFQDIDVIFGNYEYSECHSVNAFGRPEIDFDSFTIVQELNNYFESSTNTSNIQVSERSAQSENLFYTVEGDMFFPLNDDENKMNMSYGVGGNFKQLFIGSDYSGPLIINEQYGWRY